MIWITATCMVCGKKFSGRWRKTPKYCSRYCQGLAMAKYLPHESKSPAGIAQMLRDMVKHYGL